MNETGILVNKTSIIGYKKEFKIHKHTYKHTLKLSIIILLEKIINLYIYQLFLPKTYI